jgi:hypothetical protein
LDSIETGLSLHPFSANAGLALMSLRGMFQQLGFWTTILSWQEPFLYRVRLRGDGLLRLALAVGIGCIPMALLLALFAINVNPPNPLFALFGLVIFGGIAAAVLFRGESNAGGAVRICQEGITRKRMYTPAMPVYMGIEEANWPYESLSRAIIVPGQALGQSFSVLALTNEQDIEIVGIPSRINLHELAQTLAARGLRVESATFIPPHCIHPLGWPAPVLVGALGMVLALGGLGFYTLKTAGKSGGQVARAGEEIEVPPRVQFPAPANPANLPPPPPVFEQPLAPPPFAAPTIPAAIPKATVTPPEPVNPFATAPAANVPAAIAAGSGELVGGTGGSPIETASPFVQPVVGFRAVTGAWAGKVALAQLEPLYDRQADAGNGTVAIAKDGYVVGGLEIDAGNLVHAARIIFVRQNADDSLDPADSYTSEWLGEPSGSAPKKLSSGKSPVIGIRGRRAAVIDALGLVVAQP